MRTGGAIGFSFGFGLPMVLHYGLPTKAAKAHAIVIAPLGEGGLSVSGTW